MLTSQMRSTQRFVLLFAASVGTPSKALLLDSQEWPSEEGAAGLLRSGPGGSCILESVLAAICIESLGQSENKPRSPE